ncbi:alpha/beta fold hydrolase [Arthrobacter sp. Sa2CUA1]|uniref:Alpha/beta fold hydrolase n=1 Tax=Arthrobacter gallicola TaxID=2762225 RepID=A0ABR8UQC2_9MICC|nr:alpha/beta fold hydrolase [Arthrobacter gallicola]
MPEPVRDRSGSNVPAATPAENQSGGNVPGPNQPAPGRPTPAAARPEPAPPTSAEHAPNHPKAAVVIHPATAVPERLYNGFAEYLAGEGFAVLTYDYRGTGASGAAKENRRLRMRDWMDDDVPATAEWMRERFAHLPQVAVGHSLGGHALALNNGTEGLQGFMTVASHAGVSAAIPNRTERARVELILRVLGPGAARLLGYVPGRKLGLGEDMPAAAMLEWSKWSRTPGYFFDDPTMHARERTAQVRTKVLCVGLDDDPWATPEQIGVISRQLVNAKVQTRTYAPADAGVTAIGHMGYFRRGPGAVLWPEAAAWLAATAGVAA